MIRLPIERVLGFLWKNLWLERTFFKLLLFLLLIELLDAAAPHRSIIIQTFRRRLSLELSLQVVVTRILNSLLSL